MYEKKENKVSCEKKEEKALQASMRVELVQLII